MKIYLTIPELEMATGLKKVQIYTYVKKGLIPAAIKKPNNGTHHGRRAYFPSEVVDKIKTIRANLKTERYLKKIKDVCPQCGQEIKVRGGKECQDA